MTDSLRPIRALAAWLIIAYIGLASFVDLLGWLVASMDKGLDAVFDSSWPGIDLVLLLAVAVTVSGVIPPAITGARTVALVAFFECGVLLVWGAIIGALTFVQLLSHAFDGVTPTHLTLTWQLFVHVAGVMGLAGVTAFFAWRVYVALDPLANDIAEIADQLADLDEEEAEAGAVAAADPAVPRQP